MQPSDRVFFLRAPPGNLRKRACGAKMLFHFTPPPGGDKGELALAGLFLKKGVSPFCKGPARMCTPGRCVWQLPEIQRQICSPKGGASSLQPPSPCVWQFTEAHPARSMGNPRSWPVLANANRGDWFVKIPKRFCRSFHLSRNDEIASKIIARDPF